MTKKLMETQEALIQQLWWMMFERACLSLKEALIFRTLLENPYLCAKSQGPLFFLGLIFIN